MFRITSECKREKRPTARHRMFALGILSLGLALTLILTTVSIRVTYVTDSNGASQLLLTSESDPTRLMSLSGIEAAEGDRVYYTAFGDSLATLNIERAFTVTVEADGQEIPVKMVYGTVGEALEKAGITLGPDDYTVPEQDSLVGIGSRIEVHRVRYEETVEYQTIPYETEYVYTSLYFRDTDRVTTIQAGSNGQCAITTRHRWVDGELENSIVTDVTTTVEPQDALLKTYGAGAPVSPVTGPDGTTNPPSSYSKVLTGKATGYYSRTGNGASGLGLGYGTVAVDPDVIPYGTLLYITSTDGRFVYGYAVATDTGIALQDGHVLVDLFYETYAESVINGAINVNVYVVG
ncbi:3D domain-containing protein [Faecalibacterium sp. An77]|uniref:3D domain-containing protein n=1 Tax=Faecalibacterium sp. An77 TaxID=1965655 RepID=UPI001FA8E392|nr:3D domain-containing protein [Faecalibacterium sp. An77]